MGVVYAAYDPDLDRKIALKLLRPSERNGLSKQRLMREAQAMARLSHPNVVTVHEVGEFDGRVYISMEYVKGLSLDRWLEEGERTPAEILKAFVEAGHGLAAAHRAGLIHRDFKPANVLVGEDGRVRVADFGLARTAAEDPEKAVLYDEEETHDIDAVVDREHPTGNTALGGVLTVPGSILGTPRFMAPEQVLDRRADAASDQFSFCVALFEALFRIHPFGRDDMIGLARRALAGKIETGPPVSVGPLETALQTRDGVTTDPLIVAQTRISLAKALWLSGADRVRARRLIEQASAVFEDEGARGGVEDLELLESWLDEHPGAREGDSRRR